MDSSLSDKHCVPCRGGVPPLSAEQVRALLAQVRGWSINAQGHLEKTYSFEGFRPALDFVVKVGELAEAEGHHPDVYLAWGKVRLEIWTHKIGGLTESDFILAAKLAELPESA